VTSFFLIVFDFVCSAQRLGLQAIILNDMLTIKPYTGPQINRVQPQPMAITTTTATTTTTTITTPVNSMQPTPTSTPTILPSQVPQPNFNVELTKPTLQHFQQPQANLPPVTLTLFSSIDEDCQFLNSFIND
jgi:hypothetical protein